MLKPLSLSRRSLCWNILHTRPAEPDSTTAKIPSELSWSLLCCLRLDHCDSSRSGKVGKRGAQAGDTGRRGPDLRHPTRPRGFGTAIPIGKGLGLRLVLVNPL